MARLVTLASDDGHAHFAWDALLVHLWWDKLSLESVVLAGKLGRDMGKRHAGTGSITIAANGVALPSMDAQRAGSAALAESQAWLLCNGVVLEGEGFWRARLADAVRWTATYLPGVAGNERQIVAELSAERHRLGH